MQNCVFYVYFPITQSWYLQSMFINLHVLLISHELFIFSWPICFLLLSLLNVSYIPLMKTRWKVLDLAYNRRETWDKRLLDRDPDRSWVTTTVHKAFLVTACGSIDMSESTLICCHRCPWSFTLVWLWHQPL